MRTKLSVLLLALLVCAFAAPAQARWIVLDDPAEETAQTIIPSGVHNTVAVTTSGIIATEGALCMAYTVVTTSCAGASVIPSIQWFNPGAGIWQNYSTVSAAIASNATFTYLLCAASSSPAGSQLMTFNGAPPPPIFRVAMNQTSTTTCTWTVTGVAW